MTRILVQTGKATSLNEVARQVSYILEQKNIPYVLNRQYLTYVNYKPYFTGVIFIYPANPSYCLHWFYQYIKAKSELNENVIYYTTIEGIPKKQMIPEWVISNVEFIACSYYVKSRLEKVGFKVVDVIHHGYPLYEVSTALEMAKKYRKVIESNFKGKVIFGFVGDFVFRKGIEKLIEAIKILSSKRKDFHVLLITKNTILKYIRDVPNISLVSEFGIRDHVEIMGFYKSIDYLIIPSLAEGFGLPLLEANALGTIAIINKLPPFEEFSDMKNNIVFDYTNVHYIDRQEGILYEIFDYNIKELVNAIDYAIDIKLKYSSHYEDRKVKVQEHVKNLTSEKQYDKLVSKLKIKEK